MSWRALGLLASLLLSACAGGPPGAGTSAQVECAPYARQVSGILLYGEADAWWDQAAGHYVRSRQPRPGGVLVFRRSGRLPYGHVAVVSDLVSAREIRVAQANWVHHRITGNEPVIDVSPGNDWSQVRVWWEPTGALGATTYPTYGFIGPDAESQGLVAGLSAR